MKNLIYSILISSTAIINLSAHDIWLEFDDKKDEVKLYFGEFEDKHLESGEKFSKIKEGILYPSELLKEVKRNDNNITYSLTKKDDVVVIRTAELKKAKDLEIIENKISYLKTGRVNTQSFVDFDIVPLNKDSNSFKILFKNEPIKKSKITVISPTGWEKTFMSSDKGEFTIHTPWIGKYLLKAEIHDNTKGEIDGKVYDRTVHSIVYTIEEKQGLPWEIKR